MFVSSILAVFCLIGFTIAVDPVQDKEGYLKQLLKQHQNIQRLLTDI